MAIARQLWQRIETLHAVIYFAPESIGAAKDAGLRGFWMGYFGFRASPLGAVGPGPVEASFSNFHPSMVERAIPDAWSYATPAELVEVRAAAAAAALRARVPAVVDLAELVVPRLAEIVAAGDPSGRPLFAANRRVAPVDDPVAQLWQHATSLREHRGDGHVATLVSAGVDGCEAHLLLVADHGTPPGVVLDHRGWSETDVDAALARLRERGLVVPEALELTADGRAVRHRIEATTDELAAAPIAASIGETAAGELIDALTPAATAVVASGVIPFPNPMGLPAVDSGVG